MKRIFIEENKWRDGFDQGGRRLEDAMVNFSCSGIETLYWQLFTWIKVPILLYDLFTILVDWNCMYKQVYPRDDGFGEDSCEWGLLIDLKAFVVIRGLIVGFSCPQLSK